MQKNSINCLESCCCNRKHILKVNIPHIDVSYTRQFFLECNHCSEKVDHAISMFACFDDSDAWYSKCLDGFSRIVAARNTLCISYTASGKQCKSSLHVNIEQGLKSARSKFTCASRMNSSFILIHHLYSPLVPLVLYYI